MSLSSSRVSLDGSVSSCEEGKRKSRRRHSLNPCMLADELSLPHPKPRTPSLDGHRYKPVEQKVGETEKLTVEAVNGAKRDDLELLQGSINKGAGDQDDKMSVSSKGSLVGSSCFPKQYKK